MICGGVPNGSSWSEDSVSFEDRRGVGYLGWVLADRVQVNNQKRPPRAAHTRNPQKKCKNKTQQSTATFCHLLAFFWVIISISSSLTCVSPSQTKTTPYRRSLYVHVDQRELLCIVLSIHQDAGQKPKTFVTVERNEFETQT